MREHNTRRRFIIIAAAGCLAAGGASVFGQPQGPVYSAVRYDDDYSFLSNGGGRGNNPFNRLKKIPVGGQVEFTFGGQYRFRFERDENRRFGASNPPSQSFYLNRLYLFADVQIVRRARLFAEFKYTGIAGNELPAPLTARDKPDIQNLFADIWFLNREGGKLGLRGGRQELLFGKQRLLGPLDWANNRRTFDGFRAMANSTGWKFDAFVARPVEFDPEKMNKADKSQTLAGVYVQRPAKGRRLSAYYLMRQEDEAIIKNGRGLAGNFTYHTVGLGSDGFFQNFDWTAEAAYQFGDFGGDAIRAYMASFEGGYTFAKIGLKPRVGAGFNLASGDEDPADARMQTFNPLFPTAHPFLGWADQTGRQNVKELEVLFSFVPHQRVAAKLQGFKFLLAQKRDALYNAAGAATRRDVAGAAGDEAGTEIDAEITFNINVHAKVQLGYAHFSPGEFIKKTGSAETHSLIYVMAPFTF